MKKGKNRIITLTTDFGTKDGYPAIMKGVMLAINDRLTCIDITHQIAAQQVDQAAYVIGTSYHWFPEGTIHVVVVDPGVGTARRALVVRAAGHTFVGPDNGVFSLIFDKQPLAVYQITSTKYVLPTISQTFHGRDIFSPVAAWLSKDVKPLRMGKEINDYVRLPWEQPEIKDNCIIARVINIDAFGNVITNLPDGLAKEHLQKFSLLLNNQTIECLSDSYTAAQPGRPLAIIGSSGFVELAVNQGRACDVLRLNINDRITIEKI
jgi:hypothetical protein